MKCHFFRIANLDNLTQIANSLGQKALNWIVQSIRHRRDKTFGYHYCLKTPAASFRQAPLSRLSIGIV